MAYGNEIHYGVIGWQKCIALAKKLGIELCYGDDDLWDWTELETVCKAGGKDAKGGEVDIYIPNIPFKAELRAAHDAAMPRAGWTFKGYNANARVRREDYPVYDTQWGLRETRPFDMELIFDRWEMGETVDDMTLSVGLSGRYFPTFLDMSDPHGGIYNFDLRAGQEWIDIAIEEIVKQIPEMDGSTVFIKERHY
jgi:hypothetical protein